jgi:hypothetical protein
MRRREKLPNRRDNRSLTISWRGHEMSVCVGLAQDGRVLEVFCRAGRPDSDLDRLADDSSIVISLLLQHGADLAGIAKALGRSAGGEPASLIAAVVDGALEIERELEQ